MRFLFLLFLLSACGQSTQFHLLPMPNEIQNLKNNSQTIYAVRQIQLPDYTHDRNVMVRGENQKIIRFEKEKWVDLLDERLADVLYQEIKNQFQSASLLRYPIAGNIQADFIIDISIQELLADYYLKEVLFLVDYQIQNIKSASKPEFYSLQKKYILPENSMEQVAKLYNQALHDLGKEITTKLERKR